jgi:hypothetical protein
MKPLVMRSPVFGLCHLVPHTMEESPQSNICIGYVAFDDSGKAVVAIYKNGEWRDRNLRKFKQPVTGWYSLETADGSPIFN